MKHRYIYLVFSKTSTWLARALGVFSDSKYVHASLSFDSSFKKMYSFGRTNPSNPFSGGFVEENIYDGVFKRCPSSQCKIYKVKVTDEQYKLLKKQIKEFVESKHIYKYNFIGLFGVLLNKPIKRKNHYFCSQFVSEILIKSNVYYFDKVPELIRPSDLSNIKDMDLMYEGYISEYYRADSITVQDAVYKKHLDTPAFP